MALSFYYGAGSPYAWRVWLALEYKGVPYELKLLSFSEGDLKQPGYTAINPRQRVPAIVDDGFALYESAAILEYLDERYDEPPLLFPGDIGQRATIRRMVREADQYAAAALEEMVDSILFAPHGEWAEAPIAQGRAAFGQELSFWEARIEDKGLVGVLSAADFTLYPLIALALRMEKTKPDLDIRGLIGPRVAAWMARIEALPYFARTWPPHWA